MTSSSNMWKRNRDQLLKLLSISGCLFSVSHVLLLLGLSRVDVDALFLRVTSSSPPLLPVVLAVLEVGGLLSMDVLLFQAKTPSGNRTMRRYWMVDVVLTLFWACYPIPQGDVVSYQADRVIFSLLPVYLIAPQFSLQLLLCAFPMMGETLRAWLLQYGGAGFCGAHLIYLLCLSAQSGRASKTTL